MISLNIHLIIEFVKRDFAEKFAGSVFGRLWSFILPLVNILIYIIIFSGMMGARLSDTGGRYAYSIYLISAILPWTAFSTTLSRSATVFLDKKHILSKVNIALPSMPLYINISEAVNFFISLIIFYVFLIISGHGFSEYHLMILFIFMLQQLLAYALGLSLAVLTVFVRDLKEVVGIVLQIWFWFTPIVYVRDILPEFVKKLLVFNPAFILAESFHDIFVFNRLPNINHLLALTTVTFILLYCSYLLYKRLESELRNLL